MPNINDTFFDGNYKKIWKTIIPDELTIKEIDFMLPYFGLKEGSSVLDLMCGYGRHALLLGQKGIKVTAVDNLAAYIDEINTFLQKERLPVTPVISAVLDFSTDHKFDLAICMGNSINFFNSADTLILLENINSFLKPGGRLLISSWSLAEIVIKNFKEKSWCQIGDLKFLTESRFLFHPSRIETESTIIDKDMKIETKTGIDYVFSLNEMETMLNKAGFKLKEVYSIPGRKKFTVGEPRAYLVAEKS
ncbi:MAG TPA: class I SAM-dependent methyltransferase [Chitinophagaceae bacterium]|nr:class I SAM-dependent methyltransferase [Chitinophagaceae bacterium]